jgi:hypothetical protein
MKTRLTERSKRKSLSEFDLAPIKQRCLWLFGIEDWLQLMWFHPVSSTH